MDEKLFYPRLFVLVMLLWIGSYVLNMYSAYYMVTLYKRIDNFENAINCNTTILEDTRNNIYDTSRIDGIGGNILFSIGVIYILWHSLKFMDDIIPKIKVFWKHLLFLFGLALDVTGIGLMATGFSNYGGKNPQDGTAYHTSGLFGILIGSILVICYGIQEENKIKKLEYMKEPNEELNKEPEKDKETENITESKEENKTTNTQDEKKELPDLV